jgi:hypothetical protein
MNISTTKNRVTVHEKERRTIDKARVLTRQLSKAYEITGQQSAIAKAAANSLDDLVKQLDQQTFNELDEKTMQATGAGA